LTLARAGPRITAPRKLFHDPPMQEESTREGREFPSDRLVPMPADREPAELAEPADRAFHDPAATVTAQAPGECSLEP
jgi:hypothetical protein